MKITTKSVMPDATRIQIEDWSEDYVHCVHAGTLAAYPICIVSSSAPFGPRAGNAFRIGIDFSSRQEAIIAFEHLVSGKAQLSDYANEEERRCLGYV